MTHYVAVPVTFQMTRGYYYARLETEVNAYDYTDGRGTTEDEAFADLLAKLGYHEVESPATDYVVDGDVPSHEQWDPFECGDPWHPCPHNGYEVNEIEFEEMYGMSVESYIDECKRRGIPCVRNEE